MNTVHKLTVEQNDALYDYLKDRNKQNWGVWPSADRWPVPADCGAFTASQYTVGSSIATVIKFDREIVLANGRRAKKIGVGPTRKMQGVVGITRMEDLAI